MLKKFLSFTLLIMLCVSSFAACSAYKNVTSSTISEIYEESSQSETSEEESNMPEYWGFNNYTRNDNPGAPEEITSYPTTLKKVSESRYTMTSEMEGVGIYSVALHETNWGTFNLGSFNLTDTKGKKHVFATDSTDFEYVHEYYYNGASVTYSGGNHGGEALESLAFYNGETEEEIKLAVGEEITVNVLHVIEKTKLLNFPDENPKDSINDFNNKNIPYTEDQVYAKLTRKYTITGPQVKLNVDYLYVKDSYHAKIYSCMFPIEKKYGLYCDMIDKNGEKITTVVTSEVGKADYSGPMNSGNPATRAIIYGKTNPKYQFDIRVNTFDDSVKNLNNKFQTAFWDMNTNSNKLYFSRYDTGNKVPHTAGTEVHTETIWLFKYVEDAQAPEPSEPEVPYEEVIPKGTLASSGKTYTISGNGEGYAPYKANLTDGKTVTGLTYDGNWFGFLKGNENNTVDGVGSVIIDLGEETDLSAVRVHICNGETAGISAPQKATVSVSSDNSAFSEPVQLPINRDTDGVYWSGAEISGKGRYIKVDFTLSASFVFIDEVEVYAK